MFTDDSRAFSPSRLGTYQDCPRRYRYRYVEKIRRPEQSVEAYLGVCVHRALEELYARASHGRIMPEKELAVFFDETWEKDWSKNVILRDPRYQPLDWKTIGHDCLSLYYRAHAPFNADRTVGLEKKIGFYLPVGEENYRIEGYIDRLAAAPDGAFEIHDYKTGRSLPTQEDVDSDRQLAIYDAAVRAAWPDVPVVRLVWHYLRHGKTMISRRTPEQLADLKGDIAHLIRTIKEDRDFVPRQSPLCGWCEYRDICPLWAHAEKIARLPEKEQGQDDGARLVDSLEVLEERKKELRDTIKEIEKEEDEIKERILDYAAAAQIAAVFGTKVQAAVSAKHDYKFPTKTHSPEALASLEAELKASPIWRDVSQFDPHRFMEGRKSEKWSDQERAIAESVIARYATISEEKTVRLKRRKEDAQD
ncbi:MAG: RecB family exonuclease [Elusimicrobiota bacterium]